MALEEPAQPLDPKVPSELASPDAYPDDVSAREGVESIQTHISHLFLTGERVYKLKKSVDLGFVSFESQASRNEDCVREVHLNRRLAPDIYLGVAPIERRAGRFVVGAIDANPEPERYGGGTGEHCVVMRRLAPGRDAVTLLAQGALPAAWLGTAAERLAPFHVTHGLGRPAPFTPEVWRERIWQPVAANFRSLRENHCPPLTRDQIEALCGSAEKAFESLGSDFEARRVAGRAVDGHGDLHLEHFWFEGEDGVPVIIDCLEFSDELRQVDAASEVAFLAMDLAYREHPQLADYWLGRYAAAADDWSLYRVVDFFIAYRAAVRAKVEAIEALDERIPSAQREHSAGEAAKRVAFATAALKRRRPGSVTLIGGLIGSGKSSVARAVSEVTGGAIVSSDAVRRRDPVAQAQPTDDGTWQEGRYAPAATGRIYDEMLERAEAVVASGRPVILDASWSSAERRKHVRGWALERGAPCSFVEARCGREETLARLEKRKREGRDDSEAGPEIYDAFASAFEPIEEAEWPAEARHTVHTDQPGWQDALPATANQGRATQPG